MLQVRLYLDYIDPGSFLMDRRIGRVANEFGVDVERLPWEVRRPPEPMLDSRDRGWIEYWDEMAIVVAEHGSELVRPTLIPWTRKAHELAWHAREKGLFDRVHQALMDAFHLEGRDLGRVDVLVELGQTAGLDSSEARTVLGVDRFADTLDGIRSESETVGVRGVPTLVAGRKSLEGVHAEKSLRSFFGEMKNEIEDD